jgi:hypothetical protein
MTKKKKKSKNVYMGKNFLGVNKKFHNFKWTYSTTIIVRHYFSQKYLTVHQHQKNSMSQQ